MQAEIAQLVEHHFPKVRVAGPSPVFRSLCPALAGLFFIVDYYRPPAAFLRSLL